ncbi:MAG: magnesium/cobalt transporter CorA [Flavobacterium sp.]|nr:magnesium/cobalt transporter CorA [Flavobacterium sp.]
MRKIKYKKGIKVVPTFLEYTGIHKHAKTELQLFVYDNLELDEYQDFNSIEISKHIVKDKVNWINIHGMNEIDKIKSIVDYFDIDQFMLSDILNTTKRTKLEENKDVLFFNIKSLLPTKDSLTISVEQISFLLKEDILISFQEKRSDFFTHIRERIRTHSGIVRSKKADYLMYLLLDAIMENFYITIENEEDNVENLINIAKTSANQDILVQVEKHRDNFNFLKRSLIPLRDSLYAIKSIKEDEIFEVIEHKNFTFFDRLHQKTLELLEQIEYDLTTLESVSNFYFSTQNHKMNEVMKTLTVVSVFFMPLTFIVGVYGMNFDNMPELHWKYGYFVIIVCMLLLLLGMIYYFKKKKWY